MKRLLPAALCVLFLSGCFFWNKKPSQKPKESSTIATDTERDFKARWIDHRTNELVTQGQNSMAARQQAETEFQAKFSYTHVAGDK